jgi:hypothetical protein
MWETIWRMLNKKDEKETQIQKDGGYIHTTYISAI